MTIYQGDPRLIMTNDGSTLKFVGGQPVMDMGWENAANMSLFTRKTPGKPDWYGNTFADNESQKIGSLFEYELNQPISINQFSDQLNRIRDAGQKALQWMITDEYASNITVRVINPSSYKIETYIIIEPQGQDIEVLLVKKNGLNWVAQKLDPAYLRI